MMNNTTVPIVESEGSTEDILVGTKNDIHTKGFVRLISNTHDISLAEEHIPSIEQLAADLEEAVKAVWPRRNSIRYTKVHVLLIRWEEDDLGVISEIRELKNIFEAIYHYNVETYDIPNTRPEKALNRRVLEFLDYDEENGNESLLIVYYAGHARRIFDSNEPPIWFATRESASAAVPCAGIQSMLEAAESDVLLLYDCCHSAPARTNRTPQSRQSVTEAISACGYESIAPEVDEHSFTKALVQTLAAASQGRPFSVAELHTWIIGRLKCWLPSLAQNRDGDIFRHTDGRLAFERQPRKTPIYSILCELEPRRSIVLGPLLTSTSDPGVPHGNCTIDPYLLAHPEFEDAQFSSRNPFRKQGNQTTDFDEHPQILLAIRLEKSELDLRTWRDWIRTLPKEGKDIKIDGVYRSFSTLLLVRIPISVWDLLPENPAYSFIGFVTSENMKTTSSQSEEYQESFHEDYAIYKKQARATSTDQSDLESNQEQTPVAKTREKRQLTAGNSKEKDTPQTESKIHTTTGLIFGWAGLPLAVLNFPSQMFSIGVISYAAFSRIQVKQNSNQHYWQFKAQESRYIFWGICHNVCNPPGLSQSQMSAVIYKAIIGALTQINVVLEDQYTLTTRYGLQEIGEEQPVELDTMKRETLRQQNMVKRLQKGSSMLRRAKWAIIDQRKFGELVRLLTDQINILYEMLPVLTGTYINDPIAAETVAELSISVRAMGSENPSQQSNSTPLQDIQQRQRALSLSAGREGSVEPLPYSLLGSMMPSFDLSNPEFLRTVPNASPYCRSWARSNVRDPLCGPESLMIEWHRYDDLRDGLQSRATLLSRIQPLAAMLKEKPRSDSFRVLDCLGWFKDFTDTRYGITFRLPNNYKLETDPAPRSLHEVISMSTESIPYLGDRFHVAYLLAESIHAFHSTGWLHKCITSHNILLFPKQETPPTMGTSRQRVNLDNPYFTNFALSRPDDRTEVLSLSLNSANSARELTIYWHPNIIDLKGKYHALFDIYSLGIILIELGTWTTISEFYPKSPPPDFNFTDMLLATVVPSLGASMGEQYMNVVKKCLKGNFKSLDKFKMQEYDSQGYMENLQQGLLWEVVAVLLDCRA